MNVLSERVNNEQLCESSKCPFDCNTKFSVSKLNDITEYYLKLNTEARKDFIFLYVKREKEGLNFKYEYKLHDIKICKRLFLKVVKISFRTIQRYFDERDNGKNETSHWKSHTNDFNKSIENFIMSFKPEKSHYNLRKCPNKLYISDEYRMNSVKLYRKFAETIQFEPRIQCNENKITKKNENLLICGYNYFNEYRKKLNICFGQLSMDKCKICKEHDLHLIDNNECECKMCKKYEEHKINSQLARKTMNDDSENLLDTIVVTCDAQKIFSVPRLEIKDSYFASRINTLNQTFCGIGQNSESFCFISNDIEIEKNSREYINFHLMFLNTDSCKKVKNVVIWCDNCTSQNRNWSLYANLVRIINDNRIVQEKITLKYLEVGHTFNSCDNVHSCISRKFNEVHEIYNPEHCYN
jgi:hypothetical protein